MTASSIAGLSGLSGLSGLAGRGLAGAWLMLAMACSPTPPGSPSTPDDDAGSTSTGSPDSASATSVAGTSGGTTMGTGSSSTAADDTGLDFLELPDGGTCVVGGEHHWRCSPCDLIGQDCPSGEKCVPWANDGGTQANATRCVPVADDPAAPGESCVTEGSPASGLDDCDATSVCWGIDPVTLEGSCAPFCTGSTEDPQCDAGLACLVANDGAVVVCLPECDPLASTCGPDQACVPTDDTFVCTSVLMGGSGGDPCSSIDACVDGTVCVESGEVGAPCDPGETGCCAPWCDLSAPDPAAGCLDPGQVCRPWSDPAPAGQESIGVCALPR